MSVINTGSIAKLLAPGLNAIWGNKYTEHAKEYTDLFDVFSSDRAYEEDQQMSSFGLAPVKPQGQATQYDTTSQGFTTRYTHLAYSLGFIITREAIKDNLYEKVGMQRTGSLAFSMRQTKENVAANVYNRAQTAGFTGGDGVVLSSTAHTSSAGNWSNRLTTAADLSEASLEDLVILVGQATNDRGLKISIKGKKLIIPVQLQFEAARILKSVGQSGTANNDINALRAMGAFSDGVAVNHYLTDADAFFVRTDVEDGMKLFEREAAEFNQDGDFDTDNLKYKAYERYSFGWTDPRAVYTNGMGA
jgi:hypothetical protein